MTSSSVYHGAGSARPCGLCGARYRNHGVAIAAACRIHSMLRLPKKAVSYCSRELFQTPSPS